MSRRESGRSPTIGVGYASIMIIFVVICLTIFAAMSLRAAQSGESLNKRAGVFSEEYYAADSAAKNTLAQLDELALAAGQSAFFEEEFFAAAAQIDGAAAVRVREGISVSYAVPINDRQELAVSVTFYSVPQDSARYDITQWSSRLINDSQSDDALNVWDGGDIG